MYLTLARGVDQLAPSRSCYIRLSCVSRAERRPERSHAGRVGLRKTSATAYTFSRAWRLARPGRVASPRAGV